MTTRRDGQDRTVAPESEERGGFLGRWSRLKQEAARGRPASEGLSGAPDAPAGDEQSDAHLHDPDPAADDEERLAEENQARAEAIDLESLDFSSDYSAFLKKGVSRELKRQALRKLWTSDPVLACVDGLNDYDEDFRKVEVLGESFRSSWQVGRGFGWMDEKAEDGTPDDAVTADQTSAGEGAASADDGEADPCDADGTASAENAIEPAPVGGEAGPDADPSEPVDHAPIMRDDRDKVAVSSAGEDTTPSSPRLQEPARPPARRRMRFE